jgi:membrane-associated phospholipid phosphatase
MGPETLRPAVTAAWACGVADHVRPGILLISSWLAFAALVTAAGQAHATAPGRPERPVARLEVDLRIDIPLIAGTLAVVVGGRAADLGPDSCRWCERGDLNDLDRWFRDKLRRDDAANLDATVAVATGLLFVGTLGLDALGALSEGGGARSLAVDALIVAESVAVAVALTSVAKAVAGRQRPYALAFPDETFDGAPRPKDENASFFSGHAATVFALTVSSAMVASLRGYRTAPHLWSAGLALASAVSLLRISQDQHYFTDLLAGAVVGASAGVAVPFLHRAGPTVVAVPVGDGYQVCLTVWF